METLYSKIGENKLRELVDTFYDSIFNKSSITHLFNAGSQDFIREKQFLFLTQLLGGPTLYSDQFGHPKMRMRHIPHSIGNIEKEEWLRCMKLAILSMNFDKALADELYDIFPKIAEHMRNK